VSAAAPAKKAPRSDRSVKLDTDAARLLEVASLIEDRPLVDVLSGIVRTSLRSDPRVLAVMDAVSASPTPSA
jgi:oligoribonuclease (3'-5' exoribonuclease)